MKYKNECSQEKLLKKGNVIQPENGHALTMFITAVSEKTVNVLTSENSTEVYDRSYFDIEIEKGTVRWINTLNLAQFKNTYFTTKK